MNVDLLIEVIKALESYQKDENRQMSIADFGLWLNKQSYLQGVPVSGDHSDIIGRNELDIELSKLIIFLNRYARLLVKKGLSGYPELVSEDFTYLYILMSAESMTKIQLIEKNVHEKPTGLEVIKRLLKHGLIAEKEDEQDKRSKRVFLTEKGKALFFATTENLGKVAAIVSGTLTIEEKKQLFALLKKLEDFHNPIYLKERNKSIDELMPALSKQD